VSEVAKTAPKGKAAKGSGNNHGFWVSQAAQSSCGKSPSPQASGSDSSAPTESQAPESDAPDSEAPDSQAPGSGASTHSAGHGHGH